MRNQGIYRRTHIRVDIFETPRIALAVARSTLIKAHADDAMIGQGARQQHKLTVAAHAILRTAHDNQNPPWARLFGKMQHAVELILVTGKMNGYFLDRK